MLTLHDGAASGNGYKVRLLFALLGIEYTHVVWDTYSGQTRTPEYLAINPVGKIPTVTFEDDRVLFESNAILLHFADGTPWIPADPWRRSQMYSWLFWEQYSHEPAIAVARSIVKLGEAAAAEKGYPPLAPCRAKGREALGLMNWQLGAAPWLVAGDHPSIADLCLYAYTHVADEGGIPLDDFPHVRTWCARIAALPGHVPLRA